MFSSSARIGVLDLGHHGWHIPDIFQPLNARVEIARERESAPNATGRRHNLTRRSLPHPSTSSTPHITKYRNLHIISQYLQKAKRTRDIGQQLSEQQQLVGCTDAVPLNSLGLRVEGAHITVERARMCQHYSTVSKQY